MVTNIFGFLQNMLWPIIVSVFGVRESLKENNDFSWSLRLLNTSLKRICQERFWPSVKQFSGAVGNDCDSTYCYYHIKYDR